jgi:class 3 adenylate cyclase/tetratricopeptide (TPR) repeat protein
VTCPSCGSENVTSAKFCVECGTPLALACPSCGTPYAEGQRFCAECGTPLVAMAAPAATAPTPRQAPAAERRLVSVLFADLVGFTTLSESRDAEAVRDLLSSYFDTCRSLIERYGGTVEKFIGDAVMAVWGTPAAQEDDAERAVRAALELVAAVPELDAGLRARAGVVTGEAAVTLGAEGQGMVAGDLVNTASRVQSVAEPGTVLVGESTRRATEVSVAYEAAGGFELKGKAEPVPLSRALRVTAARGGALKSEGLEPPFVGRDRELRLVKELFHASGDERKAHLVSVVGIAGTGKSRLGWEFFKYLDGVTDDVWWHRGRCLAYGEGVAYWALAEMVRGRAGIVEGEEPESARAKLLATVDAHLPDAEERRFVEPRLAHLLGVDQRSTHERDDLFAAWRLFFERLAERSPVVLVFEDMQWADASLLDFVEYLLEWSRSHPIFALVLARPDLTERHPDFGKGLRNATTLSLEPLAGDAMEALLGFAPGLPESLRAQILDRAEGIPLYAVETVRMLLDRGLLVREGDVYRPTGPVETLEVPETLHALIAARLDGLSPDERRVVKQAAVLGKTFTKEALAHLSGLGESELEPLLSALVRKEVVNLQADPRSPERGQYGFLQELLKHVAYETLAKRERKSLHLAAAEYLEGSWGPAEHEIVEVVASHYLAAFETTPDAEDAGAIRAKARAHLAGAAERAASLAANEEAERYFEQAAALAEDPLEEAALLERAGEMAWSRAQAERAEAHYRRAIELFEGQGQSHPAARVAARLGEVEWQTGRLEEALDRMEHAYGVLSGDEPDEDLAALAAQLGRLYWFHGDVPHAAERVESALEIAETLWLPEIVAQALITKGIVADSMGRSEESIALLKHALELALENDLPWAALRAHTNLGDTLARRERFEEALENQRAALALAGRVGNTFWDRMSHADSVFVLAATGAWDEALEEASQVLSDSEGGYIWGLLGLVSEIYVPRGNVDKAKDLLTRLARAETSTDVQERSGYAAAKAALLRATGSPREALAAAEAALGDIATLGATSQPIRFALAEALESALELGDLDKVEQLVEQIETLRPRERSAFLRAEAARFRGLVAAARGAQDGVEQRFKTAEQILREYGMPFRLAVVELEHAEWLLGRARSDDAEPLLAEAREIFERLDAKPWLERASQAPARERAAEPVPGT